MNLSRAAFVLILALVPFSSSFSKGVSPWLPVNQSPLFENDIEKLAAVTGIARLKRPYSLALIQQKLPKIKNSHPALYRRLDKALMQYQNTGSITHSRLTFKQNDQSNNVNFHKAIPNAYGTSIEDEIEFSAQGIWQPSPWYGFYAGVSATDNDINPAGSTFSFGLDWAQIDIGYKNHWWSPFQGSAKMISTHAPTMPSISMENSAPLELFGLGVDYELFIAQMSRQPVLYQGVYNNADKPLLSGVHLGIRPTEWFSLGFNRMFQFGGGERPLSLGTLARALFDPRGADNDASVDEESGNQIASIVSKINFEDFVVSAELAGEDTSNNKAWQLGNTAITVGLFVPSLFSDTTSLTYEYSEWQKGWYINNVYDFGYVHEGNIIGDAYLQDPHLNQSALPGSSHYLKSIYQHRHGHAISFSIASYDFIDETNILETGFTADVEYSHSTQFGSVFAGANGGKDSYGEDFLQVRIGWQWK